mgnify:CR=1 FL=1
MLTVDSPKIAFTKPIEGNENRSYSGPNKIVKVYSTGLQIRNISQLFQKIVLNSQLLRIVTYYGFRIADKEAVCGVLTPT